MKEFEKWCNYRWRQVERSRMVDKKKPEKGSDPEEDKRITEKWLILSLNILLNRLPKIKLFYIRKHIKSIRVLNPLR